ncbi:MAG: DUF308 domain-containing protein [Lachnospiraceae bacterium]|nr:DUF308 domain-containing protein [Lachnospiraceae bacterium]
MLFQELGKVKRTWIMTSIVMITIAIIMIMCPVRYIGSLIATIGYLLLVWSVVTILDFISSKKVLINYIYLTGGLFLGLLGLFVLTNRLEVLPMLSLMFGLGLLAEGIADLFYSFMYTRRSGRTAWIVLVILSILTILCGLVLLTNPFWDTPVKLKLVIGLMLLFSSVVSIVRTVLTWPFSNV